MPTHDFLQSPGFNASRDRLASRPAIPEWVQRGLMRSFGEDDVTVPYRSRPVRSRPRSRVRPSGSSGFSNLKS